MFNAMTRAEIWLQDTLDKPIGLEDLANHLGYSASQVRRQFRQRFQLSPSAYREKRRLERAAVLLAFTPLNIAQIAQPCGYHNHSSFSRAFQRHYQVTPRDYRRTPTTTTHQRPATDAEFETCIRKSDNRQMLLMRLYESHEHINGPWDPYCHKRHLACLQARLRLATTTIALPDLLADKAGALNGETHLFNRTDIGLYLTPNNNAQDIAIPVPYRRVDLPTHYYVKTCFKELANLSNALAYTITFLLYRQDEYYVSGHAPQVLWKDNHLELRIPLLR
ncbi:helix-turn-helix transcriptional regulator [Halovibrio sp. HP20-50]|uniref:helix-turn-helix transcriptional regulator n=1 Tax=Halovibrio sp. HP20-59 TaxID=3080275 RepID=UPI00294B41E6|nr:helix-turn-helix transcriptional regulator [Halovibrio sp. HP20-59]MEA2117397.1 helix-turn-helix transcriptional regulator [Halovibrio sp. HP20-59]